MGLSNIIFILVFISAISLFLRNLNRIINNIKLGRDINRSDRSSDRWRNMFRVALGQSKMTRRPIAGILHIVIYAGFVIVNVEVIEIIVDGIFGTHRFLSSFLSDSFYNFLIASFEILAFLVLIACVFFYARRNLVKIKRFWDKEMTSWPRTDANLILIFEILLMVAFLTMNAADSLLQSKHSYYVTAGSFPISQAIIPYLDGLTLSSLILIERFCWWFHILGILAFLNYVLISKHLHIFFAFPSTYYANLNPLGKLSNLESVAKEVSLMMDPNTDPYVTPTTVVEPVESFGAKDVTDLNWVQLLNAYSCTECGRCTSNCPANYTGKLLSPRKILMDTRDRITEFSYNKRKGIKDSKTLLGDYITSEELWACTSCNACTDSCPIDLDPLSIILDMRRYLVMEESAAPTEINMMFTNIENNGAPWQFPAADRLKWKDE
ncbi:MAG: Fe-S oxidoreductase [Flavobacteriales bacterium TMED123]|nr:MAG: Fe-S oxidoreductase [Flavobacteriales bacterium TMED123]|tara:strand:+ start:612 stop:1922 length:1311 start_codon:yes stop_codon:yes gene_type:complete